MGKHLGSYFSSILSNLPNSVYWKDKNGVYLGANKCAVQMVGLTSCEEIVGKTDYDFTSKRRADGFRKNDLIVINTGTEITVEEKTITPNGDVLCQLSTKRPLKDDNGKIIGVIGITVDITERKKQEVYLTKQTKTLQEALLEKKRFLNNISHEIRTPVHIMSMLASELHRNVKKLPQERLKYFLTALMENGKRLSKLVNNLLDLSKNHNTNYTFKRYNIFDVIHDVIKEFSLFSSISLKTKNQNIFVEIDEIKIAQVLRNLLDNAIKYGKNSSIIIEIEESDNDVIIKVQNKTIGVPKEEEYKVFEPFFQCTNNHSKAGGIGLGLSICRDIIYNHKGKIWIETDDNNITTVTFTVVKSK